MRIRRLQWRGTAQIFLGGKTIEIGVSTVVEPFIRARSDSWLLSDGPAKTRALLIEPDGGWVERDGKREALPPSMVHHERQQYGLYGYMLRQAPVVERSRDHLRLSQPGYRSATLHLRDRKIMAIDYVVDPPAPGAPIAERVEFGGVGFSGARDWPHVITIAQNGAPYFALSIAEFDAS